MSADTHSQNSSPVDKEALIKAVKADKADLVTTLLQREDIDFNQTDQYGDTALLWAIRKNTSHLVGILIENNRIDVNLKYSSDNTALILAVKKKYNKTPTVNEKHTPISEIIKKRTEIIEMLLKRNDLDINAKDKDGSTVLSIALENNDIELASIILKRKDINIDLNIKALKANSAALLLKIIYSDLESYKHIEKNIDAYLTANPGSIFGMRQTNNDIINNHDRTLITNRLIEKLKSNNLQLKYSQIIPYNVELENFKQLATFFELPQKNVDNRENPIIIASRAHNFSILEYAYDHRKEQPWATFWQQAGDENNTIIEYFLSTDSPTSDNKTTEMFNFILNNLEIVKNINYGVLYRNREANNYRTILLNKFGKSGHYSVKINSWFNMLLRMQESMKNITKYRKTGGQSAHDEDTAKKALQQSDLYFSTELNKRYPEQLSSNTQIDQAMFDLRLLILKQLIESKPIKDNKYYSGWQKLINLLQLENYSETTPDGKLRTFAEYKQLLFDRADVTVLNAVLTGVNPTTSTPEVLEKINQLSLLLQNTDLGLDPKIADAWEAVDPLGKSQQNFADEKVKSFVLFCMLLATEDVNTLVNNSQDVNDLFKLMARSISGNSDKVRRELFNNRSNEISNQDLELIKEKVKTCLLEDQQLMGATVVTESVLALNDKSCSTGILTRFADNVLGPHYKYSLLDSEDALLTDKIEEINKHMCVKFSEFVEQKVLDVLLSRLNAKIPQTTPRKSSSNRSLSYGYNNFLGSQSNKSPLVATCESLLSSQTRPKTITELKDRLVKLELDTQQEVLNTLFSVTESNSIKDYAAMSSDPDIGKLFDALFSVNADNWWKLYINDCTIEKYSSLLAKTPSEMTSNDTIKLDEFDTTYKRAELLNECFNPSNITNLIHEAIKKDNPLHTNFSETEKKAIEYYSLTIAPPAQLKAIAEKLVKEIDSIPSITSPSTVANLVLPQDDENIYYQQFKQLLSKPPTAEDIAKNPMAIRIWKPKLEQSLVTAILFECDRVSGGKDDINTSHALDPTDDLTRYNDILEFAKAACTTLLSSENKDNQALKSDLVNPKIDMPVLDFIKTVSLADDHEIERQRTDIINSLQKIRYRKIV